MSYDLQLYLSKETPLTPPAGGETWIFNVDPPAKCEDEDVPEEYLPLIGRRRWLVGIYIEGSPTPDAFQEFERWLLETLSDTKGVLIDEQADRWQNAKTSGPLPSASFDDDCAGEMNFYMSDAEAFYADGFRRMLAVIKDVMPGALPKRFGQYEPLQGKVENGDTGVLEQTFTDDPDMFLKAKTPFAHIYPHVPCSKAMEKWHPNHFIKKEFLATHIGFELRAKAFLDPTLIELFKVLSDELGVFYSEIRKGTSPIRAWFWTGLPKGPVEAICLGHPYIELWPEAVARGVVLPGGTLSVAPSRLETELPDPPQALADPGEHFTSGRSGREKYAKSFPFKIPNA